MIQVIWEFRVAPENAAEFERRYGPEGDWARLFARSAAWRGTELLRDAVPRRYLTVDRWTSQAGFDAFRAEHAADYAALDRLCENLTLEERCLGTFERRPSADE